MIKNGKGQELSQVYVGNKAVSAIYIGLRLIWESVSSCFGSGVWNDTKPWVDTDAWKDF